MNTEPAPKKKNSDIVGSIYVGQRVRKMTKKDAGREKKKTPLCLSINLLRRGGRVRNILRKKSNDDRPTPAVRKKRTEKKNAAVNS